MTDEEHAMLDRLIEAVNGVSRVMLEMTKHYGMHGAFTLHSFEAQALMQQFVKLVAAAAIGASSARSPKGEADSLRLGIAILAAHDGRVCTDDEILGLVLSQPFLDQAALRANEHGMRTIEIVVPILLSKHEQQGTLEFVGTGRSLTSKGREQLGALKAKLEAIKS
jgi:hypothetical protein